LDQKKLAHIKQRLEEDLRYNQALSESLSHPEALRDSIVELSVIDNHPADVATEVFERSKDIGLRDNALIQVDKIKEALAHVEGGTYGYCDRCGKQIPEERLEAMPQTTLCIHCKETDEHYNIQRVRPVEEEVLWPPFGRTFHDLTKDNAFDGEDSWQAVSQYGTAESPSDVTEADDYTDTYIDSEEPIGGVENVEFIPTERDPGRPNVFHYSTRHGKRS
jgi:YteA family regulatory protein